MKAMKPSKTEPAENRYAKTNVSEIKITYYGYKVGAGPARVLVKQEHEGRTESTLLKHVVWHSPDGFQWGYGGSGPADLALSILTDYLLRTGFGEMAAKRKATLLHQDFKWAKIATTKGNLLITGDEIAVWLEVRKDKCQNE